MAVIMVPHGVVGCCTSLLYRLVSPAGGFRSPAASGHSLIRRAGGYLKTPMSPVTVPTMPLTAAGFAEDPAQMPLPSQAFWCLWTMPRRLPSDPAKPHSDCEVAYYLMAEFSEQFRQYITPSEQSVRDGITAGLIVLDTNVILSAYRFAPKAREELLSILTLVKDRLWIPYQVGLEFHRNRFSVIMEHDAAYKAVIEALDTHRSTYEEDLEKKIRELVNRAALSDNEQTDLLNLLRNSLTPLASAVGNLRKQHGVGRPAAHDAILARLQEIFSGKVGKPYEKEEEEAEKVEAAKRVQDQIPPGYKDTSKQESHGDYFLWSQTLKEVRERGAQSLVFVTGDVKEDWYLRMKGQTVMARPELSLECREKTAANLVMLPTRSFLAHAETYLHAQVSDDTLRQAEKIATTASVDRATHLRVLLERDRAELVAATMALDEARVKVDSTEADLAMLMQLEHEAGSRLEVITKYIEATQSIKGQPALEKAQANLSKLHEHLAVVQTARRDALVRRDQLAAELARAHQRREFHAEKFDQTSRST